MNYSAKMIWYRKCFAVTLFERACLGRVAKSEINQDLKYWLNELGGLGGVW